MSDDYRIWQKGRENLNSIIKEAESSEPTFRLYIKYREYAIYNKPKPDKYPKD